MKDYFILESDKKLSDALEIKGVSKIINIDYVKTNQVHLIDTNPDMLYVENDLVYPDFIDRPVPLISNKLWTIFNDLNLKNICFKPIFLTNIKKTAATVYWLIIPMKINCLSGESEFNKDGSIKILKIDKEMIGLSKIFKIQGILENYIVINKEVAKAIEADIYGCVLRKIN